MLLRSLLLLLFSTQVFSAGITIDVDLQMTIDTIKYVDPDDNVEVPVEAPIYVDLVVSETCPEKEVTNDVENHIETDNELALLLSELGFVIKKETRDFFGEPENSFSSHYDGYWSIYDDVNRKLIRNWDDDCSHAPRDILLDTNVSEIDFIRFYKELNSAYVKTFSSMHYAVGLNGSSDENWSREMPDGLFQILNTTNNKTHAKIEAGKDTGLWELNPVVKKLMTTNIGSHDNVIETNAGLVGYSIDPPVDGTIKLQWLEQSVQKKYSYTVPLTNNYHLLPLEKGTVLVAEAENGWKFQWLNHGEAAKIIATPNEVNNFFNCQYGSGNIFCLDRQDDEQVNIWRLLTPLFGGPIFEIDSVIQPGVLPDNSKINNFYSLEGRRVIFTQTADENGVIIVDSEKAKYSKIKDEYSYFKTKDNKNLYLQLENDVFSVVSVESGNEQANVKSLVSKSEVFTDDVIVEVPDEPTKQPIEETPEEREGGSGEADEPRERAELSGVISLYYLFAIMLLLVTARRKS